MRIHTKKLTIVVIPEADASVRRFAIQRSLLWIVPASILILCSLCVLFFYLYQDNAKLRATLEQQLIMKQEMHNQTVQQKEQTIARLEADITGLTEQANQVLEKMEQLENLEDELRDMTAQGEQAQTNGPAEPLSEPSSVVQIASAAQVPIHTGTGGVSLSLYTLDARQMAEHTSDTFHHLTDDLDTMFVNLQDAKHDMLAYQHLQAMTPSLWPVQSRQITSRFGYRKDPFSGYASFHSGIDIGASTHTKVMSTADGTVLHAGYDRSRGYNIRIQHGNGIETWYMHLSEMVVDKGDQVQKGDWIGQVGSTGRSTGPHLHYEVLVDGERVDPRPYMNTK
ncbi:peptidoglycan DD-metalloendopeptidase family protein [Marinicrinis sediminis]|uniref:Peptidoglycan DD-metalloendopeptidase family protein n=1 Tax=Marinicrinis sediminis TaxID=1652465 RepID=A0ABW5R9R1_9BACL